jgi:peptide/nickel transport system permease protein
VPGENRFEDIDWEAERRQWRLPPRTAVTLGLLGVVAALFGYEYLTLSTTDPLVAGWVVSRVGWLWLFSWVVLLYLVWPVLTRPARAARYLKRLRRNRVATVATLYVVVFGVVGVFGPLVIQKPEATFVYGNLPPWGFTVDARVADGCAEFARQVGQTCHGTLAHPLGTTSGGEDLLAVIVYGTRLVTEIAMIATALLVPLATVIGSLAAVLGGWVDSTVTTVIDVTRTIPAIFVFLLVRFLTGDAGVFHLVLIFGIANAGSVASVVRSRALNEVDRSYVQAARAAGASRYGVLRDHILPNVAHVALTAAVLQIPILIVLEATLSYLPSQFGNPLMLTPPTLVSWGRVIGRNMKTLSAVWWPAVFPVIALVTTVLALNLSGEGLRRALGPEGR